MGHEPIRMGVLAASRIAAKAVVAPAHSIAGVEIAAVGARDLGRAQDAANEWGVAVAYGSYEELIAADDLDAIYIATPAARHREWAIATIEAGKHLLCEKPLASNADDARVIADVAAAHPDIVAMEAFHWRYHPIAAQIAAVIDGGGLGTLQRIEGVFDLPGGHIAPTDIRWDLSLGGGSTMDLGCYPIQWVRFVAGAEPEVIAAAAVVPVDGVDGSLTAELRWESGVTGMIGSSMIAEHASVWLRVTGDRGELFVANPLAPQSGNAELRIRVDGVTTIEAVDPTPTYHFQMLAFLAAIRDGTPFATTMADGVANMSVIDACYRAAGLAPRPSA